MSIGFFILLASLLPAMLKKPSIFALMWVIGSVFITFEYARVFFAGACFCYEIDFPNPIRSVSIELTKLASFFGLIIGVGFPLGIVYGRSYQRSTICPGLASHLFMIGVLGISMHAILWVRHSLIFLMLWEIMSLSSFYCIVADRTKSIKDGISYLVMVQAGAVFLLAGFALAYRNSGSFDLRYLQDLSPLPLICLLIGFGFKAGFFPLYSWLPKSYPVAPSHVAGIMSGLMFKIGLFGMVLVLRVNSLSLSGILVFVVISLLTAFLGVVHAVAEGNLKKILAYSSVENMGLIGLGLSMWLLGRHYGMPLIATMGFIGAMLHAFFHSQFKSLLFYLSGNLQISCQDMEIDQMGGLGKKMPYTAAMFLIGVGGISALPLFSGFISEFSIYSAMLLGIQSKSILLIFVSVSLLAAMAFIGALAMITFVKLYATIFLGSHRCKQNIKAEEISVKALIPMFILSALVIGAGLTGGLSLQIVKPLLAEMNLSTEGLYVLAPVLNMISIVLVIMLSLFGLIYLIRRLCVKHTYRNTWGCGYQNPNSRMQYTSLAFIQPLSYFLLPFVKLKKKQEKALGLFPQQISYTEEVQDFLYELFIIPVTSALRWLYRRFENIHNGRTNSYIAWNLGFLIFVLILVLGVLK